MLKLDDATTLASTEHKFSILHPKNKTPRSFDGKKPSYARPTLVSAKKTNNHAKTPTRVIPSKGFLIAERLGDDATRWDVENGSFSITRIASDENNTEKPRTPRGVVRGSPRAAEANPELLRHVKDRSAKLDRLRLHRCGHLNFTVMLTPNVCSRLEYMYLRGNKLRALWDTSHTPLLRCVSFFSYVYMHTYTHILWHIHVLYVINTRDSHAHYIYGIHTSNPLLRCFSPILISHAHIHMHTHSAAQVRFAIFVAWMCAPTQTHSLTYIHTYIHTQTCCGTYIHNAYTHKNPCIRIDTCTRTWS